MAMVVVFGFFASGGYILLPAVLFSALLVPHASLLFSLFCFLLFLFFFSLSGMGSLGTARFIPVK